MTRGGLFEWFRIMLAFPIYTVRCSRSHSKILVITKLNSLSLLGSALPCSSVFFFLVEKVAAQFFVYTNFWLLAIEVTKFQPNSHLDHMKGLYFTFFFFFFFLVSSFPLSQRGKVCRNLIFAHFITLPYFRY